MKRISIVLGVILMIGLFGCGQNKYRLELDGYGLSSKKTAYAPGAPVTVTFDRIGTDTDYSFYPDSDDVKLDVNFENEAYVISFTMPDHDVRLSIGSSSSMAYVPMVTIKLENQVETADIWIMEDTPEKRKQSVWGDATIKECAVNEPLEVMLGSVSKDDLCIVRMIDDRGLYYESYNIEITDGKSVEIKSKENGLPTVVCVCDSEGNLINEYEMFVAAL